MQIEPQEPSFFTMIPLVHRLDYPPVTFHTREDNYITDKEVNVLYATIGPGDEFGPRSFLRHFDRMVLSHRGLFPMPGWYVYMVASYFLEACNIAFRGEPGYEQWKEAVLLPKRGISYLRVGENQKKALLEDYSREPEKVKRSKSNFTFVERNTDMMEIDRFQF